MLNEVKHPFLEMHNWILLYETVGQSLRLNTDQAGSLE